MGSNYGSDAYGSGPYGGAAWQGGPLLLTDSPATIFTSTGRSLIHVIWVSNPSGADVDLTMSVGTDAVGTRLFDGFPIGADSERGFRQVLVLEDGEILQAFASQDAVLDVLLDGQLL